MTKSDLSYLATPGTVISLRATPGASRNLIKSQAGELRVYVTKTAEHRKANAAVIRLLSKAVGVPKSRLELIRGATARDKIFRVL